MWLLSDVENNSPGDSLVTKNILALVGLVALVIGLAVWQYGFFRDVKQQIERETAVARAQTIVRNMEERAAALTDRARKLRIDARTREKEMERDVEHVETTKQAVVKLAGAARDAGLPKPSEATPNDLQKSLPFGGRSLTAGEVYRTLEKWQRDAQSKEQRNKVTRVMIDRIRSTADQLEQKQSQFASQVQATRATLERLEMQRDLASLDKELAELGASASGNPAGELKDVLETLQKQIDEYESTSEVLGAEQVAGQPLTPDDVLAGPAGDVGVRKELDSLWDQK
jgi:chromosome segregation ATPase